MTLKDQLQRHTSSRDPDGLLDTSSLTTVGHHPHRDITDDTLILDEQANSILDDDLVEAQLTGRVVSPITAALTRSASPFTGHKALPHYSMPL